MTKPLTPEQLAALRAVPVSADTPNRLRVAMALADVKMTEVSDALPGVNYKTLSAISTGRLTNPALQTAQSIAEFFGCAIEDLFPPQVAA